MEPEYGDDKAMEGAAQWVEYGGLLFKLLCSLSYWQPGK